MSRPLLVLRPEPGNSETVARARAMGLGAHAVPLFAVEPVAWEAYAPEAYDAVLLNSANALRHGGPGLARYTALPVYAVGDVTADAARRAGFKSIVTGEGDVADLIGRVPPHARLLHLSGENVTPFDRCGLRIDRRIVYRAAEAAPPPDFAALIARNPAILVHSRRAGKRLAALVEEDRRTQIALICISAAAAEACGAGWASLAIAAEPRDEAMLNLAKETTGRALDDD